MYDAFLPAMFDDGYYYCITAPNRATGLLGDVEDEKLIVVCLPKRRQLAAALLSRQLLLKCVQRAAN